jgi:uncharacterized protein (TIGR03437 family)
MPRFVGGNVAIIPQPPDPGAVRAAVAGGSPLILVLRVTSGTQPVSHFVVATGIGTDGSIQIYDPDPAFGRTHLSEYTQGFVAAGQKWMGELAVALRVSPAASHPGSFAVVTGGHATRLTSGTGECGFEFSWPALSRSDATGNPADIVQRYCDGNDPEYQLEVSGQGAVRASIISLNEGGEHFDLAGGATAGFRITRVSGTLSVAPQEASLRTRALVNAATYTHEVAPGSLAAVLGSGLARSAAGTHVSLGGINAAVVAASPFQITFQVPSGIPAGMHTLRVESPFGSAEQTSEIRPVAPAIFAVRDGWAIANSDGQLNNAAHPAKRGETIVIYATGLQRADGAGIIQNTVSAFIRDAEARVTYAGLAPGFIGVYQINCVIPITIAPGMDVPLVLRQGGVMSSAAEIAIF